MIEKMETIQRKKIRKTRQVQFWDTPEIYEQLVEVARAKQETTSDFMRRIVRKELGLYEGSRGQAA